MDAKDRIKEFIDYKGISINQFEQSIGASNGYWRKVKNISAKIVSDVLRVYSELSADWVITGEGSMLRSDEPPTNSVTSSTDAPAASAKPDESILYNMYKDLQTEKEKIRLEKESEIKELNAKMLAMSEEIGRLKAKLGEDESEAETHPKGLGQKTAEDVSIKKRSSQSYPDAPSVGVPSGGR